MKKVMGLFLAALMGVSLLSCGQGNSSPTEGDESEEFVPSLDKNKECDIDIVGSYDNFEALEAEFDKFNEYYPNVRLSYRKLDDYNNTLATVLDSSDKPNIFFSYTWMMGNDKYSSVVSHMEELSNKNFKFNLNCIRQGLINQDASNNVYMVPVFSRTYGMLVNNDLFKKEGITIPSTWDTLVSTSLSFKDKGYVSPIMGYSLKSSSCFMNTIAYPLFVAALEKNPSALALANDLDPSAGEYMRDSLKAVTDLVDKGCINLDECDKIADNYKKVLLRFFEGDVPMMVCTADTVSGTKKREGESEAFKASPFNYSFYPIPLTKDGGYFIDSPSVEFSVNKDCKNLDMTNEFMKFLISSKELNAMASIKRLVTPTKDMPLDSVYEPFGSIPKARIIFPEVIGIKDPLTVQLRIASYKVGRGEMTIDEAINNYGSFKD